MDKNKNYTFKFDGTLYTLNAYELTEMIFLKVMINFCRKDDFISEFRNMINAKQDVLKKKINEIYKNQDDVFENAFWEKDYFTIDLINMKMTLEQMLNLFEIKKNTLTLKDLFEDEKIKDIILEVSSPSELQRIREENPEPQRVKLKEIERYHKKDLLGGYSIYTNEKGTYDLVHKINEDPLSDPFGVGVTEAVIIKQNFKTENEAFMFAANIMQQYWK